MVVVTVTTLWFHICRKCHHGWNTLRHNFEVTDTCPMCGTFEVWSSRHPNYVVGPG